MQVEKPEQTKRQAWVRSHEQKAAFPELHGGRTPDLEWAIDEQLAKSSEQRMTAGMML